MMITRRRLHWRRVARLFAPAAAALALLPVALHAQAVAAGTLAGRVLDAGSGAAVGDAVVTLEPVTPGLVVDVMAAGALGAVRSAVTGPSGAYRFTDVAAGTYRLRIERLGYRAATLVVDVRRPGDAGVSIALELEPVVLQPVRVMQRAASSFQRAAHTRGEAEHVRIAAERERQALFPSTDTRVLTYADVIDGVTLGEGDVFRALQRFAGVGTRDDYTAELWTRGGPWTQTRVTFDGVPLFNPVHAVGVLSAVTPEILGSVFFYPGVRPASLAEGAAGMVELRTRPAVGSGAVRGVADVSLASAKLVLEQRTSERLSWIVAARRSHLDVMRGGVALLGLDTLDLPFVFHDVAARIDIAAGRGVRVEASALHEQDRLKGDVAGVLERTDAHWGNTAGRVTMRLPLAGLELSQSVGASRFRVRTDERTVRTRAAVPQWTEPASRNDIDYVQLTGAVVRDASAGPQWSLGYDVVAQTVSYDGSRPRYHATRPDTTFRLTYDRALTTGALWGDAAFPVGSRIIVHPGLRLEHGGAVENGSGVRTAPRITARMAVSAEQNISVSAGRVWQHVQSIAVAGPSIHPAFHASHFWVWPDAHTPAARADIVNVGTERWLGRNWLGTANVYVRHATGLTLPDPTPGRLGRRPLFVRGENDARGIELSVRRIGARWSTSLGYTRGESTIEVDGARYPAPADRRHVVDAMLGARIAHGLRASAAYTAMTGAPFTRAYSRSLQDCTTFGFGCDNPSGSYIEEHNAERTPDYRALDVSLLWSRALRGVELGAYVQVRNVLGRDNASTYAGSAPIARVQTADGMRVLWDDRFERGLQRLPLLGLRATF